MKRRSGTLEPEDRALWDAVTKSVRPIVRRRREAPVAEPESAETATPARRKQPAPTQHTPSKPPVPKAPPLADLDRRTRSRVARGRIEIDARLDLHGHTLERARPRLERFLVAAQENGAALVLVITGKGGSGALRREVPLWLSAPHLRAYVIGYEEAAQHHGGAGALYVRIRRRRG
jgi:DNA-nicking Smr family endonuclease